VSCWQIPTLSLRGGDTGGLVRRNVGKKNVLNYCKEFKKYTVLGPKSGLFSEPQEEPGFEDAEQHTFLNERGQQMLTTSPRAHQVYRQRHDTRNIGMRKSKMFDDVLPLAVPPITNGWYLTLLYIRPTVMAW
jgi:hypothetical protein